MLKKSERVALIILMFLMPLIDASSQIGIINIHEAGADHTGKKVCTQIIEEAITNLSKQGGGEVYFPAGQYLTGPIELKSNITLNVGAGAVLKFTDNFDDYLPMIDSRWEGVRVKKL